MSKPTIEHVAHLGSAHISVVITAHSNGTFFVVAVDRDVGTFGTIVHARRETSLHGRQTVDVATLLGDRGNRMPELWSRMVLETCQNGANDVVFCFGVKKDFGADAAEDKALCRVISGKLDELLTGTASTTVPTSVS